MKNFVIFFQEKEGTSPLVRLLDNLPNVSVLHQTDNSGWEPFDRHNCGPMILEDLENCLEMIFDKQPLEMDRLNEIYTRTATKPLEEFHKTGSVGFKMRFRPISNHPRLVQAVARRVKSAKTLADRMLARSYKRMLIDVLRKNGVVVFMAVRQDVFRWAISKYHGDGSGKKGHLQFKLADGQLDKRSIPSIHVDCTKYADVIEECEQEHARKRALVKELREHGIEVHPLRYEDFLRDKMQYFERVCEILEIPVSEDDVRSALNKGSYFKKVHSDDISDFVTNHEEITERFGTRFEAW